MSGTADLLAAATGCHRKRDLVQAEALYRQVLASEPGHPEALRGIGAIEFETGRYEAAELTARQLVAIRPRDPAVRLALGMVMLRQNRPDDAAAELQGALAIDPFHLGALINIAELWRVRGRIDDALMVAHRAVSIDPANADACNLMGAVLQSAGQPEAALEWNEKAAALRPGDARIQYNLGVVLQDLNRAEDAIAAYRRAIALEPRLMEPYNNLGLLLVAAGETEAAIDCLRTAVTLAPGSAAAHNSLGKALYEVSRLDEATASFERALAIDAGHAESLANIGAIQRAQGRLDRALATLDRAIELKPGLADAHVNRGVVLRDLGRLDEAHETLLRATAAKANDPELHIALALSHLYRGEHPEALASADQALKLAPKSANVYRRVIALLLYQSGGDPADRFAAYRGFGVQFGRGLPRPDVGERALDQARRLRIGYLTSDFRGGHPVARNMEPVLAHHDRRRFEIFVYADITAPDQTTDRLKVLVDGWREVAGIDDRNVAAMMQDDRLDILVCLAGMFDRNRPLVATYRPAPVQVSFHDPVTSGIAEMDYLISDPVLSPRHGRERFVERVVRLPHFYIHEPLDGAPPVGPLPMLHAKRPVFGCFNNPAKLSAECLALWGRLMSALPNATLRLKFRDWFKSNALRRKVETSFAAAGVDLARIEIVESDPHSDHHLQMYNHIDVALDPFPFTGSTTTFESLWMGVPVVSLRGETMVSRWSASMLDAVGLGRLAAADEAGYIAAAAALIGDPARLTELRGALRGRVAGSALCDAKSRTRQIERVYRAVWGRLGCRGVR